MSKDTFFHTFKKDVLSIEKPRKFTYPFYYTPHLLSKIAAEELQTYLINQQDFEHNFDNDESGAAIGKMFGVLVVEDEAGNLGFLAAFSGKMANSNHHKYFVPPVFDILQEDGFFLKKVEELNLLNSTVTDLEKDNAEQQACEAVYTSIKQQSEAEIAEIKDQIKKNKQLRKLKRQTLQDEKSLAELSEESKKEQVYLKHIKSKWKKKLLEAENKLNAALQAIEKIKKQRKQESNKLQQEIFEAYTFLNQKQETASLLSIFKDTYTKRPPAGAGECAAPKLLQYAFKNNYKPISMAEFWWGNPPGSEIRKHGEFYPACKGKCEPILGHMLKGMDIEENPILSLPQENPPIKIVYEDESIVIINKPEECLSVPGKNDHFSVLEFLKDKFPEATGPLLLHRLDMSTSGILVAAKTASAHKYIQRQFIKKTVFKKYIAILDGEIGTKKGIIELPLRPDFEDRPRQLVCYEHGKQAVTYFEVLEIKNGKTKIAFFPKTGRTHQLRVHAAFKDGLNTPILGDDLYGKKEQRLHLHAAKIKFIHPQTKKEVTFKVKPPF